MEEKVSLRGGYWEMTQSRKARSLGLKQSSKITESPVLSEIAGILTLKADNKKLLKSYRRNIKKKYNWEADCLITRNKDDYVAEKIPVLTPEEFLASMEI